MPRLYNLHKDKDIPKDAVYIGRPSKYGNNYSHLLNTLAKYKVMTRKEAIQKFIDEKSKDENFIEMVKKELKGKDLVCFCFPLP